MMKKLCRLVTRDKDISASVMLVLSVLLIGWVAATVAVGVKIASILIVAILALGVGLVLLVYGITKLVDVMAEWCGENE